MIRQLILIGSFGFLLGFFLTTMFTAINNVPDIYEATETDHVNP